GVDARPRVRERQHADAVDEVDVAEVVVARELDVRAEVALHRVERVARDVMHDRGVAAVVGVEAHVVARLRLVRLPAIAALGDPLAALLEPGADRAVVADVPAARAAAGEADPRRLVGPRDEVTAPPLVGREVAREREWMAIERLPD